MEQPSGAQPPCDEKATAETQPGEQPAHKPTPCVRVSLVAAVDRNDIVCRQGQPPDIYKTSGQMDAVRRLVADHTTVIGYRAALAMDDPPRGRTCILLDDGRPHSNGDRTKGA
ncbi:dihydrofolate reductase [Pandoravirus inopinatum]|uniref:Dihydrofolate reductase n=1 Tax=Pandoravirus inopinatum TaxID=1605721 RepID=A0A0B5J903_9VIRU|nr:dihydrofolate reductase [Pandoravirus inopinatum]AJF97281.1 dihydrofolate reductase [Pandoravirus inopinatum]